MAKGDGCECPTCGRAFDTERGVKTHIGLTHDNEDYTPDEGLLDDLRAFADSLGRTPERGEMNESGPHSGSVYEKRFGSWNTAVKAAGLTPTKHTDATESELVEELRRLADDLGQPPTAQHMTDRGKFAENTYLRRFGSWNAALRAADLQANQYGKLTREELSTALHTVADELGRGPSIAEMIERGQFSCGPYMREFGSWSAALQKHGYEPVQEKKLAAEEVRADIQQVGEALGRTPLAREYRERGDYSPGAASRAFGSWNAALETAGFDCNMRYSISGGEIIAEIQLVAAELDHPPTRREFTDNAPFSGATCGNHFGTWLGALAAAGFESVPHRRNSPPGIDEFGPNWMQQRKQARERDGYTCQICGEGQENHIGEYGRRLEVHHITPRRTFVDDGGVLDYERANRLDNLMTLCLPCHREWESIAPLRPDTRNAMAD